jgi:hypothetical protein
MIFLLVMFAIVTAISLGNMLYKVSNQGEDGTDVQLARLFLSLVSFVVGIVMIDGIPIAAFFTLVLSLVFSNWDRVFKSYFTK